jgi:hypothetical protein
MSVRIRKQLIQWSFIECGHAQDLEKSVEGKLHGQPLLYDGHKGINGNGNPDLRPHGVLGSSVEGLDPQVLFDPAEEQLDLPAKLVEHGDGQCGQKKVVRQEREVAVILPVIESDAAKILGVFCVRGEAGQSDRLVAGHIHGLIDMSRIDSAGLEIRPGANDEESPV